jgi:ATP-dependent helicase/nuclease subunit A
MANLTIYKASAGSGKTFTLTVDYITRLVKNPRAYRNILAVTFANDATAEMKERILSQMYGIATSDKDSHAYMDKLKERCDDLTDEEIRRRVKMALGYLLHDYHYFKVSTIDSFFQTVVRNLARELKQSPNFDIIIDSDPILNDAVDHMIADLTASSEEMQGIIQHVEQLIDDDTKPDIARGLKSFGKNIFKEVAMEHHDDIATQLGDSKQRSEYLGKLTAYSKAITNNCKAIAQEMDDALAKHGLVYASFSNGERIIKGYVNKIRSGNLYDETCTPAIQNLLTDTAKWTTKGASPELLQLTETIFQPLLQKIETFRKENNKKHNTVELIKKHYSELILLSSIRQKIEEANKASNSFLLSETNDMLHEVIGDNDSSFVFEKIGTTIDSMMIDEFQDTSAMQWENFKMLLVQGLSEGHDSLLVGDVKQSIYRWRNSDWNILNNLGRQENERLGGAPLRIEQLDTNRRSETRIIDFNNETFVEAVKVLNNNYRKERGTDCQPLVNAYADVMQKSPRDKENGYVKVTFLPNGDKEKDLDYNQLTCQEVGDTITKLHNQGVEFNDIAILARKKGTLAMIADYLRQKMQISVVSSEAFLLSSSTAVQLLIEALRVLADEDNVIALFTLMDLYVNDVQQQNTDLAKLRKEDAATLLDPFYSQRDDLRQLPLYELMEKLFELFGLNKMKGQDNYLFAFFDGVNDYLQKNPSDIATFLGYWDETLHDKSAIGGDIDGVHLFTIHKSKGLQFHTVILPACDWKMVPGGLKEQLVWVQPRVEPFDKLKIVPVDFGKNMQESFFEDEYYKEQLQLWIDNLNLMYVGFTRAEKNLIVLAKKTEIADSDRKKGKTIDDKEPNNMGIILQCALQSRIDEKDTLTIGTPMPSEAEEAKATTNRFVQPKERVEVEMQTYEQRATFRQSNSSADFVYGKDEEDTYHRFIDRGKVLHQLFSMIKKKDDIDGAVDRLTFEGVIGPDDEEEIRSFTHQAFDTPEVQEWYTGQWDLLNERTIIWQDEKGVMNRRPDRVMKRENEVVVVDFKFGRELPEHKKQVLFYLNLLSKIGYKNINGYLWYVTEKYVEQVNVNT